jgi:uncharacterized membrane protein
MDIYEFVKLLHVVSAMVWVGGGFVLVFLAMVAQGRNDKDDYVHIVRQVVYLSPRFFIPSSLAVLVFGVIAAWIDWGFAELWIDLGIVGWLSTFVTGNFLIRPRAEKIEAMVARTGVTDQAVALGQQLLNIARFDFLVLFIIVADMVIRPTPVDWMVLAVMAVLIAGGAFLFIAPAVRGAAKPAAAG